MQILGFNGYNQQSPSFGLNNPNASLYRAEQLKTQYAQKGLDYLLPNQVWSTSKIMEIIDKTINGYEELLQKGKISIKSLNKLIQSLLPEDVCKKIELKNFQKDYPKYLKKICKYPKKYIKPYMESIGGVTINPSDSKKPIQIYIPIEKSKDVKKQLNAENIFVHELKHALTGTKTNIRKSDYFNTDKETLLLSKKIFNMLERKYLVIGEQYDSVDLNFETLVEYIFNRESGKGFKTIDELKQDIEKSIGKLLKEQNLSDDFKTKNFYNFLAHNSADEKEAYTCNKILRKYNSDKNCPVLAELNSLKYQVFEDVFKQKAKTAP